MDPVLANTLYAATDGSGVFKSVDGGETWKGDAGGLPDLMIDALAVGPPPSRILYAGSYGDGVFKSTDGGATWSPANRGLPAFPVVRALLVDPSGPSVLYAALRRGLFRSLDGGANWQALGSGRPGPGATGSRGGRLHTLAMAGSGPVRLFAGTSMGVLELTPGTRPQGDSD